MDRRREGPVPAVRPPRPARRRLAPRTRPGGRRGLHRIFRGMLTNGPDADRATAAGCRRASVGRRRSAVGLARRARPRRNHRRASRETATRLAGPQRRPSNRACPALDPDVCQLRRLAGPDARPTDAAVALARRWLPRGRTARARRRRHMAPPRDGRRACARCGCSGRPRHARRADGRAVGRLDPPADRPRRQPQRRHAASAPVLLAAAHGRCPGAVLAALDALAAVPVDPKRPPDPLRPAQPLSALRAVEHVWDDAMSDVLLDWQRQRRRRRRPGRLRAVPRRPGARGRRRARRRRVRRPGHRLPGCPPPRRGGRRLAAVP